MEMSRLRRNSPDSHLLEECLTTAVIVVTTTVIFAALRTRGDHLVQEVPDGHRSASTAAEAEANGRDESTGLGSGVRCLRKRGRQRRRQRTRPAPFAVVWTEDIEPLLRSDAEEAFSTPTILEWLYGQHPGSFERSQLLTLQCRVPQRRGVVSKQLAYASAKQSGIVELIRGNIGVEGVN